MAFADFHVHTVFSDGKSTVLDCVRAAREKGLCALGISDHSDTPFDHSYCMRKEKHIDAYEPTVREAQKIARECYDVPLLLGIEHDLGSEIVRERYDYTIGSVHYIFRGDEFFSVDSGHAKQQAGIDRYFGGNTLDFAKTYFEQVVHHAEKNKPTFMGHLDLLSKYSSFDETDPVYRHTVHEAIAEIVKHVPIFEVSAGPIIRNLKTIPYPNPIFLSEIKRCGGRVILSSDAHKADKIAHAFPYLLSLVAEAGFDKVSRLTEGGVVEDDVAALLALHPMQA